MPSPHETAEQAAERLAPTAAALVQRLRTEPADQLRRDLLAGLTVWDRDGLIMLLAAAVDPNVDPEVWWGWVRHGDVICAGHRLTAEEPDDDGPDPAAVEALIADESLSVAQVMAATGLSREAIESRRRRARRRRGQVVTA